MAPSPQQVRRCRRSTAWTGAGPGRQRCSKPVPMAGRGERLRSHRVRCRRALDSIDVLRQWMRSLTSSSRPCPELRNQARRGGAAGNPLRQDRTDRGLPIARSAPSIPVLPITAIAGSGRWRIPPLVAPAAGGSSSGDPPPATRPDRRGNAVLARPPRLRAASTC